VLAERIKQGSVRELAAVTHAKFPANHPPGLEIEDNCQVVPATLEPQVGEILHPATGVDHVGIAEPVLWAGCIPETRKAFQGIGRYCYLCRYTTAVALFLAWPRDGNASECSNTTSFGLAPTKLQGEPAHTVQVVLFMRCKQRMNGLLVSGRQYDGWAVVATT
jgi:hypothetical protein